MGVDLDQLMLRLIDRANAPTDQPDIVLCYAGVCQSGGEVRPPAFPAFAFPGGGWAITGRAGGFSCAAHAKYGRLGARNGLVVRLGLAHPVERRHE